MKTAPTKLNALRVELVQHVIEAQATAHRLQRVNAKLADAVLKAIDALALVIRSEHGAGNSDLNIFFSFPTHAALPPCEEAPLELRDDDPRVDSADSFAQAMKLASQTALARQRNKELSGAG